MVRFLTRLATAVALFCIFVIVLVGYQQTIVNSVDIQNSTINSTPVGPKNPSTGNFTNFNAGASTLGNTQVNGAVTATGGFNGNLNGNASSASSAPWAGITSKPYPVNGQSWQYAGQGGQPNYLWGTNDGQNMLVWSPSNFSVNYSNSTGSVAWGGVTGRPYPISPSETWNWNPQGGQTYVWGTPDAHNMYPYNPANFSVAYAATAPWGGISGTPVVTRWNWSWSGQPGQPSWLWGSNDGGTMQVWNPSNFSVAAAVNATNSTNANNVPWAGVSSKPAVTTWNWSVGQPGGQPYYIWGTNDGGNEYLWQTGTLNVSYANSANTANHATNADYATSAGYANHIVNDMNGYQGRFKMWQTGATCTTGNNSEDSCAGTMPIPGPAYSSTYYVTCMGGGIVQGYPVVITSAANSPTTIYYSIRNGGSANGAVFSQFNYLTCMTWGN